ncbi:stalk domain-containing protein [Paenibacillus campi]|uniref:stalk domain-containing protein n=1 Tax=Paenibacillus campi TaxID=3106031 RepID=UPI002AFF7A14|nr:MULTISPECIES: stalk domain-containing protein [unclassified Paenibacillus]
MKLNKKPMIIAAVSALAVSGTIFANSTYASDATKQLKAVYANIKVMYNNKQVTVDATQEPFMINGTTYVPLRVLGDAVGKKVTWNNTDKAVSIADTQTEVPQSTVDALNAQIQSLQLQLNTANTQSTSKDTTISQLQAQVSDLNSQITTLKNQLANNGSSSSGNVSSTMTKLQTALNTSYGDYRGTGAVIELTGTQSAIRVSVRVNESTWNDTSSTSRRTLLQNIVDDIHDNTTFKTATISGTVYNKNSTKLMGFTVNNSNSVIISSNVDLATVQKNLNNDYGTYRNIKLSIELSNDNDEEIVFRVYANKSDWNLLTDNQGTSLMSSIAADIDAAYSNMGKKIYGFVYDSSNRSSILKRYN